MASVTRDDAILAIRVAGKCDRAHGAHTEAHHRATQQDRNLDSPGHAGQLTLEWTAQLSRHNAPPEESHPTNEGGPPAHPHLRRLAPFSRAPPRPRDHPWSGAPRGPGHAAIASRLATALLLLNTRAPRRRAAHIMPGEDIHGESSVVTNEVAFTGQSGAKWRYWTDQPLGTPGGFGGVFAAEAEDGTPMAVKVVQKQRPSGTLDDCLLHREIDIGRRVAESGNDMLLPVLDAADASDKLLLVMARADDALMSVATPMGEPEVISVMTDIATGLQQLHSIGIIHRDLKPANVLHHHDRWKLADFGIARDQEIGTQDPTFIGWGSRSYMAPELWEGKSPTVKTDLYALGCLGYELLTGAPPYTGDQAAIRAGHLTQAPPDVPCGNVTLKNLITRLIAKNPGDRPQDARAVFDRLHKALLSRNPVQEAIACGLGVHAQEKSRTAAAQAAAAEAAEIHREQVAQAKADLREILSDALEGLQADEPEATLQERGTTESRLTATPSLTLSTTDVRLRIDIWEGMTTDKPVPGDTMILAACVMITNPRYPTELNSANLVYEQVGDRLSAGIQIPQQHGAARQVLVRPLRTHPRTTPWRLLQPPTALLHDPPRDTRLEQDLRSAHRRNRPGTLPRSRRPQASGSPYRHLAVRLMTPVRAGGGDGGVPGHPPQGSTLGAGLASAAPSVAT